MNVERLNAQIECQAPVTRIDTKNLYMMSNQRADALVHYINDHPRHGQRISRALAANNVSCAHEAWSHVAEDTLLTLQHLQERGADDPTQYEIEQAANTVIERVLP